MTEISQKPGTGKRASLDKKWHLATDEFEVGLTELEFSIIRVSAAFERWQSDCLACCIGQPFSGSDTAVLHVIRMHDRSKSISEIGRLLKRDDQSNLQYGIRKLLKAGLIEKAKDSSSKKGVTYQVSSLGREVTDNYAEFRRELLVSLTTTMSGATDLEEISKVLNLMSGLYDQASCVAATHKVAG
ncbi:MAG: winged helix DNA-binding protein [Gammaproteobacteria bacterium]|nr:winged helix DNA-binding protein [Gammaproteobacteria bacterium]